MNDFLKIRPQRPIWPLAGPLILANLSVAILGLVDTAVVGHLAQPYFIGAVAVGSVVFDFLYWGMGFLRMGTTGLVAQHLGKQDHSGLRTVLAQAIVIAMVLAVFMLLLQSPIIHAGLRLLGGSQEVTHYAQRYLQWAIWGAPAVLLNMVIIGALLGMHKGRATLVVTVVTNIINMILDIVLVFGFEMDVRGVALATVIAQYTGAITGLFYLKKNLAVLTGNWPLLKLLNIKNYLPVIALNRDIFIRTLCLIFVFAFFTRQGANQSDLILAANTILMKFQALIALGLDGFAHAAEALVGKAIGQGDKRQCRDVVYAAFFWSILMAGGYALLFLFTGAGMIDLMTGIIAVREAAMVYLFWLVLSPLLSVWCFVFDGVFIGATRGAALRNSMLISTGLVFLPLWYLLRDFGNHGLWLALMLFFVTRAVSLAWYYQYELLSSPGFISPSR